MSSVSVTSKTQRLVVSSPTSIAVVNAGPQGPAGVGGAAASYEHTQTTLSTSWVINHNLGFFPNITTFDDTGQQFIGRTIHHSPMQAEIQTITPRTGKARAS